MYIHREKALTHSFKTTTYERPFSPIVLNDAICLIENYIPNCYLS